MSRNMFMSSASRDSGRLPMFQLLYSGVPQSKERPLHSVVCSLFRVHPLTHQVRPTNPLSLLSSLLPSKNFLRRNSPPGPHLLLVVSPPQRFPKTTSTLLPDLLDNKILDPKILTKTQVLFQTPRGFYQTSVNIYTLK